MSDTIIDRQWNGTKLLLTPYHQFSSTFDDFKSINNPMEYSGFFKVRKLIGTVQCHARNDTKTNNTLYLNNLKQIQNDRKCSKHQFSRWIEHKIHDTRSKTL